MKKLTKILSLLLAVALVCTGLILAVSANNGESETASYVVNGETVTGTLAEALAAADENTTVTLMGDCTLEETFTVTKSLTVDLNGNKQRLMPLLSVQMALPLRSPVPVL